MTRRTYICAGALMVALAVAVRLNNALLFPFLRGYDGFAHFGYIWFLADAGRIPPATAGWEFFQPPGYYALMQLFWQGLPGVDSLLRLRMGTAFIGLLGLAQAWAGFWVVRRCFPEDRLIHLLAAGLMLFIPVHLYSSGFLGNEMLCAALSALALVALLRTLQAASLSRVIVLGVVLGAAMMVKFTAVVIVATAVGAIALKAWIGSDIRGGTRNLVLMGTAMLTVCGWFYARNIVEYGNPFQMSRDQPFLAQVENSQLQGRREFLEYVLFDPIILYRPQWPRGLSLSEDPPPGYTYSAMRESIPTGLYANTWFDGFGGFVLPKITRSESARRAGQVLLTLGLLPTLLVLVGLLTGVGQLRRKGWDDTIVVMLLATAGMAAVLVQGTRTVPTQAAVKATYLMPIAVAFCFWFAMGFERVVRSAPGRRRSIAAACSALAVLSVAVFTHGLAIDNSWMTNAGGGAGMRNLDGVIYYAGGQRDQARALFEWSSIDSWPLAQENLAELALEDGHPIEALYRLRQAIRLQTNTLAASQGHRASYLRTTLAENENSRAVILQRLGWNDEALEASSGARNFDPSIPEAWYNLGVLKALEASTWPNGIWRSALTEQARRAFAMASGLDPAFHNAAAMQGVTTILGGDCQAGAPMIREALAPHPGVYRPYPLETGPGDQNAAGLHRRRQIDPVPASLTPEMVLDTCVDAGA